MAKKKARAKAKAKPKLKTKPKSKPKAKAAPKAKSRPVKTTAKKKPKAAKAQSKLQSKPQAKPKTAAPKTAASAVTTLPSMEVVTTSGGRMSLSDLKGKNVVVYFYPKDDTPGCTTEGCDIRDRYAEFERSDTVVLGVSRDSIESHEKFKSKFGFPFELVSDPDEKLCRTFDVIRKKSLYGKEYMGVDRSTFIFDKHGKLRKEFRSVKVDGHAEEILSTLNSF